MNSFKARPKLRQPLSMDIVIDGRGTLKVRETSEGTLMCSIPRECSLDSPQVKALLEDIMSSRSKRIDHLETELARARMLLADAKTQEARARLDKNEAIQRHDKLRREVNAALYSDPTR
jgi:hypothetical protein